MKLNDINLRDPFILLFGGKYYLYGTRGSARRAQRGGLPGFDVYISEDLLTWSEPVCVFEKNEAFWGEDDFWAPEVHFYGGRFYMLASFKAADKCRGTHILVADMPDGQFEPLTPQPSTPADWECLDGTLYVDKKGQPHMVFCHEWLQIGNGTVCSVQLSQDLRQAVAPPIQLWSAADYPDVCSVTDRDGDFVTDGPFMLRDEAGDLYCIWSTFNKNGYAELISKSSNGDIDGEWSLLPYVLSSEDGGHGMVFRSHAGETYFVMHRPNVSPLERPALNRIIEKDKRFVIGTQC